MRLLNKLIGIKIAGKQMKTKLLKKLRKRFVLLQRNGKYKVYDNNVCLGGVYNQTDYMDKDKAVDILREWILKDARKYVVDK